MSWIEKPRLERKAEVEIMFQRLVEESPDRFWISNDQDGPSTQLMNIILPLRETDVIYFITMTTTQLRAARLLAYEAGQLPGETLAITPALLDRVGIVKREVFSLNTNHDSGIAIDIALDVEGLTHEIIDDLLLRFINGGEMPLPIRAVDAQTLAKRLARAREAKQHAMYPL